MAGLNFEKASGAPLPCFGMFVLACLFLPGGILTCFGMLVLRHVCVLLSQTLVTGAILKRGQDTTRAREIPENKCGGLARFEMPVSHGR